MTVRPIFKNAIAQCLLIAYLLSGTSTSLFSQTENFDTLYQSDQNIRWLTQTHDYLYWLKNVDNQSIVFRLYEGQLDSLQLPEAYHLLQAGFSVAQGIEFRASLEDCSDIYLPAVPSERAADAAVLPAANSVPGVTGELADRQAMLAQNVPNPFHGTTTIGYVIPESSRSARLVISDPMGTVIKDIRIETFGKGRIALSLDEFAGGLYYYALIVDGAWIDTRKMIVMR